MMKKNIDFLGIEVKTGDVMLELGRGRGCLNGSDYKYHMKLWEVPEIIDGRGNYYTIDGDKTYFYWANINNAVKVDMNLMPKGFEYSFKHGMSDISSKINEGSLHELIENSNWEEHEIKKEQVTRFEFMKTLDINTIDDIKDNIDELKKGGYVPNKIVYKVLDICGIDRMYVNNGEIGIAAMYDHMHYKAAIEMLAKTDKNHI